METLNRWFSNFLQSIVLRKSETQKQEHSDDDRLVMNVEVPFPNEIIQDILSRLPVKSIIRFRSVAKPWLHLISEPSFTKLQLTRAAIAFFIHAYDTCTDEQFFLSATRDGGSVTHIMTLDRPAYLTVTEANGLVCCNPDSCFTNGFKALVINPSTHKTFKLHDSPAGIEHIGYFFGYDESRNEHKILRMFCAVGSSSKLQVMIFSFSDYAWRKIDATVDIGKNSGYDIRSSVCVNSIVHWMLGWTFEVLVFDLTTEEFSVVKVPLDYIPLIHYYISKKSSYKYPYLVKINDSIGVVCHYCFVDTNEELRIWMLSDYESHVWVKETITFPESWGSLDCSFPLDSIDMNEIVFSLRKLSSNVISVPIYNMKTRCFKYVLFTLDHPFLLSPTVKFKKLKCYVESIMTLPKELIQKKSLHEQMLSLS